MQCQYGVSILALRRKGRTNAEPIYTIPGATHDNITASLIHNGAHVHTPRIPGATAFHAVNLQPLSNMAKIHATPGAQGIAYSIPPMQPAGRASMDTKPGTRASIDAARPVTISTTPLADGAGGVGAPSINYSANAEFSSSQIRRRATGSSSQPLEPPAVLVFFFGFGFGPLALL